MRVVLQISLALALAAALGSTVADGAVPTTIGFSARLVDETSGQAVTGTHRIGFALYDAETGGTALWQDTGEVTVDDGVLSTEIGRGRALDASVFDGRKLWLSVTLDDVTMEPRMAVDSVPYAIRAGAADSVDGLDGADLQKRVTGTCTSGNFVIAVNENGTVTCAPDLSGTGDVTAVFAGTGLQGGGNSGDIMLSLTQTCLMNQILKWNGSAWVCSADAGTGTAGDITAVTVGTAGGLVGGGLNGDVALTLLTNCAVGQVLKWNGAQWLCGVDNDSGGATGGDITAVTAGTGLQGGATSGDATLSLLTTCTAGQVLKWNGAAWACAADQDTDTNSGGDISDVIAGLGLVGGAAAGAATINVQAGVGIMVSADAVSIDVAYTDPRYLNTAGDTLTGALNAGGQRITNRGCPTGYVLPGPGSAVCVENVDAGTFTFSGCANRCRANGAHMCTMAELRSVLVAGFALGSTLVLDWVDDQNGDDEAMYINMSNPENPDGSRSTATAGFCRCCTDVE